MLGRLSLLAVVTATALVQCLPSLPEHGVVLSAASGASLALGAFALRRLAQVPWVARWAWRGACVLACFLLATAWACWQAERRLQDNLIADNEDKVTRVVLRVAELPRESDASRRFVAEVLASQPEGVPSRIEVAWHADGYAGPYGRRGPPAAFPDIAPGQVWRMALNLRRVQGAHNPHGFDYEGFQFARQVRALGSVRGQPQKLQDDDRASLAVVAEFWRYRIRRAMQPHVQGMPYGGVLLALAIGDQASIAPAQWEVFNRSGLTHLVSISGSHITMIAVLAAWAANAIWRRMRWQGRPCTECLPAQIVACLAALVIAWLYCLLAGWGVPARRTFLMLALAALAFCLRLPVSASRLLCLAAALVVILDPWAVLASGFWLSFGAVAVLLCHAGWIGQQALPEKPGTWRRWWRRGKEAARLQLAISLALLPLLALWFHQLSLASPLTNAYAIPLIGLWVTPLSLLLALVSLLPGLTSLAGLLAALAHLPLTLMMPATQWLAAQPWAVVDAAAAPMAWMALAFLGLLLAVLPHGWPMRPWAWMAMLPALCWRPAVLEQGGWQATALDVGQGAAWVVQTANHVLLFDTGARHGPQTDAAQRVILPFLRAQGVRHIDTLVVSHADLDHAGGLRSILENLPVGASYSNFEMTAFLRHEARLLGQEGMPRLPSERRACEQGRHWVADGVHFSFLWPLQAVSHAGSTRDTRWRNAQSCVLWIRGLHHSALLPADIGQAEEKQLLQLALVPKVDIVMAAHHGSRHSSSAAWVQATQPRVVVAQAGAWNRYGHPHAQTVRRWAAQGAWFGDTVEHGAFLFQSSAQGLQWRAHRRAYQRYWHGS